MMGGLVVSPGGTGQLDFDPLDETEKKKKNKYEPFIYDLLNDIDPKEIEDTGEIEEISTMGGGNVMGAALTTFDREQFVQEQILRKYIRQKLEELVIKSEVRNILSEAKSDIAENPHDSTAINILLDLLKTIIPSLETDFKTLTSDAEQRRSFRAHIINAVNNALEEVEINKNAETAELSINEEIDLDVQPDNDNDKFLDINAEPEKVDDEVDNFTLSGEDETGRNMALQSFNGIEKQIQDAYSILGNEKDKQIFTDYLIANLKLYFDKFEEELAGAVEEPENDVYQQEKDTTDLSGLENDVEI